MLRDKPVYMVTRTRKLSPHRGKIKVWCVGIECPDPAKVALYNTFEELPKWIQRKVAVLDMAGATYIKDIGTCLSADSYSIERTQEDEEDE